MAVPPYGVVIQEAVASGDLAKMKDAAKQAEDYLREWGNVPASLEALKLEISKREKKNLTVAVEAGSHTAPRDPAPALSEEEISHGSSSQEACRSHSSVRSDDL